jgi:protein-disulfide isomerase
MTGGRAGIAAALVVAGAMALAGAGISHSGQTKATQPVVSNRSLAAELDVSGDKAVLVAGDDLDVTIVGGEERSRGSCC